MPDSPYSDPDQAPGGDQEPPEKTKPSEPVVKVATGLADMSPSEAGMIPVPLEILAPDEPLPADMFVPFLDRESGEIQWSQSAAKDDALEDGWVKNLMDAGQKRIFVRQDDAAPLSGYFQRNASSLVKSPNTSLSKKALAIRELASVHVRTIFIEDLTPQAIEMAAKKVSEMLDWVVEDTGLLQAMVNLMAGDYSIYTHCTNVCVMAMAFGHYLGSEGARLKALGMGGLLHDLGMSRLPQGLVQKDSELSEEEMAVVRRHPQEGYKLLQQVSSVPYDVLMIVRHHHENADGSGYPDRLKLRRTPFPARVVKICDAYDAMTSTSPRQKALPAIDAAKALMEAMITQYGADITPKFIRFLANPY